MTRIRTNMCPNCDNDLTDAYSAIEGRIDDGFVCPFCKATLAYKRIYPTIALIFFVLNIICALLLLACLFFKEQCSPYSGHLYVMFPLFILVALLFLNIKNSYVVKTPNNKLVRDAGEQPPAPHS